MPKIRYICLSDMHRKHLQPSHSSRPKGPASGSDASQPGFRSFGQMSEFPPSKEETNDENNPTLILNGDILGLAFSMENQAAMAFERFIEQILKHSR